ncbi:cupin domain-containing protein [Patescibacteria group bacterium]|nr:cupin domain-containing protein [Patescibacteria group bacterium]
MAGYVVDIEQKSKQNEYFREVLFTAGHSQLVVMTLLPNEEIGMETHPDIDQFLRIEEGEGKVILDGEEHLIKDGSAIVVPAGTEHNFINTSPDKKLKLYTIYSPAEHRDKTIHKTKQEAEADTEDHPS